MMPGIVIPMGMVVVICSASGVRDLVELQLSKSQTLRIELDVDTQFLNTLLTPKECLTRRETQEFGFCGVQL